MFLFLFWVQPSLPLAPLLSSSVFCLFIYIFIHSIKAVRGEHLHLRPVSTQLAQARLLLFQSTPRLLSARGWEAEGGREGRKECGRKRNPAWLDVRHLLTSVLKVEERAWQKYGGYMCVPSPLEQ